jgi:hypothetical protein
MQDDMTDPEEIARLAAEARRNGPTAEQAQGATAALMLLMREQGLETFVAKVEDMDGLTEAYLCLLVSPIQPDGTVSYTIVEDPPSAKAQAVIEGGVDWIEAASGTAVRVTSARGDMIHFVREERPGSYGEGKRYHVDCFLRDHVLAGGVPLLG